MNLECCKMLDNFIIEDNHVMVYVCIKTRVQNLPCAMVWRLVSAYIWQNLPQCAPCCHYNYSPFKLHFDLGKILLATYFTLMEIDSLGIGIYIT